MDDLAHVGEFGLITRLLARLGAGDGVVVGPGDDCAVLDGGLLATADLLLEGRHFDLALSSPRDVGYKALAVNVSDIAAMGGRPRFALVSLGAPAATRIDVLESIYDGLAEASKEFAVVIVGGDTVASDALVISVAAIGDADGVDPVRRDGARPGDALCVTGSLGGAAAGLMLLRAAPTDPAARGLLERFPDLARAHQRGRARVGEGRAAARAGAHAMIDISDGLAQDVDHVCAASAVGCVIDADLVPLADGVRETAAWLGQDATSFALRGGDDYELAIAMPVDVSLPGGVRIGVFDDGRGVRVRGADGVAEPFAGGWDHFRGDV